jgi:hypothetical protein
MYLRFGPFEGSRVAVVVFNEFIDGKAQLSYTGKAGSSQGLAAQDAKPNLNLIEPGGVGWSEMKMHIGVSSQPTILFWLVAGKIIQNHMNFLIEMSAQDSVHELEEFPATPAPVVAGLNLAAGNV